MKNKQICVKDIAEAIERIVPKELQEEWDNSGLNVGFEDSEVSGVLTCLEVDKKVVREAKELGCSLIVTHHPLLFSGVKSILDSDPVGGVLMELIKAGISVYSCHTPFDKVKGGNNDALASLLRLEDIKNLDGNKVGDPHKMLENVSEADIGRTGNFSKAMKLGEIAGIVCEELKLKRENVRVVGDMDADIQKVGMCTGAGSDLAWMALKQGCQLFVTGDVKYHEAQDAKAMGIALIDAGHYGTEKMFGRLMKEKLDKELDGKVKVTVSEVDLDPFVIW